MTLTPEQTNAITLLRGIAGETTDTIVGLDRPRIDAARNALDLPPLMPDDDVASGVVRRMFVLLALERDGLRESEECFDSSCPGYFAEDEDAGHPSSGAVAFCIARCDACAQYPGDVEAARAYVLARFERGHGYVVTAWQDDERQVLGAGSNAVNAFTRYDRACEYGAELLKMSDPWDDSKPYCRTVAIERVKLGAP